MTLNPVHEDGGSDNFFEAVKEVCSEPIKEEPPDLEEDSKVGVKAYYRCNCLSFVHEADLLLHSTCCSFFQPCVLVEKFRDYDFLEAHGLKLPRSPIKLRLRKLSKGKKNWALANSSFQEYVLNKTLEMSSEEADTTGNSSPNPSSEAQEDSHASLTTPTPADLQSPAQSYSTGGPLLPDTDESPFGDLPNFELSEIFGKPNNDSADGDAAQTNGIASPSPPRSDCVPDSKSENEEKMEQRDGEESSSQKTSTTDSTDDKSSTPVSTPPTSRIRMRPMDDLMATSEVKVEENAGPLSALNVMISDLKNPHTINKPFEQMPGLPPNMPTMTPVMPPMAATILPPVIPSPPVAASPVMTASPVMPASPAAVPNLPSGVSLQKRPPPPSFPTGVTITKQPRRDSESSSTSSLSPSATPPPPRLPDGITLVRPGQAKQQDPVANLLASRGVSVVSSQTSLKKVTAAPPPQVRNNGALTITTASPNKRPRPGAPVMATVDLTDDSAPVRRPPVIGKPRAPAPMTRPRGPGASTVTCDVCDKVFAHAEALRQHMQTHAPGRRPMGGAQMANNIRQGAPTTNGVQGGANSFPCRFCIARYPNQLALSQHMQRYHPDKFGGSVGSEFALPVVDLSDNRAMNSLVSLGIKFCIPLGNLTREEGGGMYGVPVVPMDGASNPAVCNLGRLSCSNLLPIGPMKSVMRP